MRPLFDDFDKAAEPQPLFSLENIPIELSHTVDPGEDDDDEMQRLDIHSNDKNIAYLAYRDKSTEGDGPFISGLHVHPDYRRLGLAKRLMQEIEKRYPGQTLRLRASPYKDKALSTEQLMDFYRGLGYESYDEEEATRMMKKLSNALIGTDDVFTELPQEPQLPEMRSPDDPTATRKAVYDGVLNAANSLEPMTLGNMSLKLTDVRYVDEDEDKDDDEELALDSKTTLGRRLKGRWRLENTETGDVLDEQEQVLGVVPRVLDNGSVIFNGSRYAFGLQQRIRSGGYVRTKKNGELENLMNVERGTGARHRYLMDPSTGILSFNVGSSKIPISDVLETLGATKEEFASVMGEELAEVNWKKRDSKAVNKLAEKLGNRKALAAAGNDTELKKQLIREAFDRMRVDPEVNERTLGVPSDRVDKSTILAATKKLVEHYQGNVDHDDRDHASFQKFLGVEDVFAERLKLDAGNIRRQLLFKARQQGKLKLPTRPLDKQFQTAVFDSGLAALVDAPNPLDILDRTTRLTVYGDGGIGSSDSTPDSTRNVNHTYIGFKDGLRSVESQKVGADTFLASGAKKGADGQLYVEMFDRRLGKPRLVAAKEIYGKTVTESRKPDLGDQFIVVKDGKFDYASEDEIDFIAMSPENGYNQLSNLVPGKAYMVPHRPAMASRMMAQSVELQNREAPLLQSAVAGSDGQQSYEELLGRRMGAVYAPDKPGTVTAVKPNRIEYVTADGEKGHTRIYTDATLGRKSRMHNFPKVQVGDRFEPGQLLASSNYTDDNGATAVGVNLRVADMTHPEAYEDAYVISESAAKNKLASVHLYRDRLEDTGVFRRGVAPFVSVFGNLYKPDQLKKLNKDGVVQVGQILEKGDPMILAMEDRVGTSRVHRRGGPSFKDATLTYHHDDPGEVIGVFQDKNNNTVVKTRVVSPLKEGDKVALRNGLKGVVVIKPDAEMPQDESGQPFEAIVPRLGVISRKNPIVKHEILLSKVARKRGQAYRLADFGSEDDLREFVKSELARHDVKEKEEVIDPITGSKIPGIVTGEAFFMKLHHMSESKAQGRSTGRYTGDGLPAKGGDDGGKSKRIGLLAQHALLAGGGHEFLRGTGLIRGQQNTEFMQAFLRGDQPREPEVPARYHKYMELLKLAGINPLRRGTETTLLPMVDTEVARMAGNRTITNAETVDLYKDQKPIPGGLFDPRIFGDGDRPAKFTLSTRLPNPAYQDGLRRIMGVKQQEFRDIIAGKQELGGFGSGTEAIGKFLDQFDVDKEIEKARSAINSGKKVARDEAVKRLGFLKAMKNLEVSPKDFMRQEVLVLPPNLRPISMLGSGRNQVPVVNDLNYLYRELFDADSNYKELSQAVGDKSLGEERLALYDTLTALTGFGDPVDRELKQKNVKGALRMLMPGGPKASYMQRKLLGNTADASGRGVVRPNSKLGMDEVGIPKKMAWEMFSNHIVRDLVRRGMPIVRAKEEAENQTERASEALQRVIQNVPVLLTRDPALHQFNTIGQMVKLVDGSTINVNPLVVKGMTMDFDGDTSSIHVPITRGEIENLKKRLMPSKMLRSPADFKSPMYTPNQDYALGVALAAMKRNQARSPKIFRSEEDAERALARGEISLHDPIRIIGE